MHDRSECRMFLSRGDATETTFSGARVSTEDIDSLQAVRFTIGNIGFDNEICIRKPDQCSEDATYAEVTWWFGCFILCKLTAI